MVFSVNRKTFLPNGGNVNPEVHERLRRACRAALRSETRRIDKRVVFSADAFEAYRELYGEGQRRGVLNFTGEGLFGQMIARGPAHVLRVSLIFAILDCSPKIELPHLAAALAVWDSAVRSTFQIFGDKLGMSDADIILKTLRDSPEGMTRTDINNLFGRNALQDRIEKALAVLIKKDFAKFEKVKTGGAPATVWTATNKPPTPTPDYLALFRDKDWKVKLGRSTKALAGQRQKVAMTDLGDDRRPMAR
jgi:hypothetical protein